MKVVNPVRRSLLSLRSSLALIVVGAALAACSTGAATTPAPAGPADVTISAASLKFEQAAVTGPAGRAFTLRFDNKEAIPHDVDIKDASGKEVFGSDPITNASKTFQVPALAAGSYQFLCSIHPDMKGTLDAK